ncbi:UBP-type zinc finger domain-containing protein [Dyadobacter chenwenxiniae]|uniref:UBP-type zinc finger domain-containing protein n=1 Tax=Dyadobacter chenwenxiniae TaxID=2906456 RepID=A0A9X1TM63_9BACT|nr:UBP-type zinc finger domain-containing protein [Dyadobacter chenwenxiniae]MCF0050689.1 UBP-type zinc finger domain-containing protein [Dyadobacter chenwenxiniae]MCF0063148.1 UBP-type zinc finger domain-containing protein [Dyadobacter chenwenxiniae]UON84683.1 UBP-type zinc finger domain-containing protein [Dyadobacter chenwenxiniae]
MDQVCQHISEITEVKKAAAYVCEECVKADGRWLHLRTCQTCGATLCCDSSPAKHMTQHYHQTGHPVASSAEPGEQWLWCYQDESFVEYN